MCSYFGISLEKNQKFRFRFTDMRSRLSLCLRFFFQFSEEFFFADMILVIVIQHMAKKYIIDSQISLFIQYSKGVCES